MGCRNARRRSELEKRGRAHGSTNTEVTWSPRSGLRYLNIVRGGVVIPARNRAAGVRESANLLQLASSPIALGTFIREPSFSHPWLATGTSPSYNPSTLGSGSRSSHDWRTSDAS